MRIRSDKAFLAKDGHFGLKVEVLLISVFKKSQLSPADCTMRWMDLRKLDRSESVQLRFSCKRGVLNGNQVRKGFNFWTLLAKQWCLHQRYKEDGKPWHLNGSVKIERIHKRKCLSQQGWKDGRQCHWWWWIGSQQVCQCPDIQWQRHLA